MQQRILVRARNLATFRRALVERALAGGPLAATRRAVIVPTRASAELVRQSIEEAVASAGRPGAIIPDLLTRDEWLARLHSALPGSSRWLTRLERQVILERAARDVINRRRLGGKVFHLRPGLVAAMLEFHDELRRRQRTVRRLARALFDELRVERGTDRGSESLIDQTCFLGFTFLGYARGVAASGGLDEHGLRAALLASQPRLPFDELIVAVADHPADPRGLWPADFDLVGRLAHLARLEIVMTDEAHDAGFRERLEQELPGIEESRAADVPNAPRVVVTDAIQPGDPPILVSRDREEELRQVARVIRGRAETASGHLAGSTAVVFHRPLPYLYLAQQVMDDARVPYQAFDALPLAAEPYAALLDLALSVARSGGARDAVMALLRSPLVRFEHDGRVVSAVDVAALDRVLIERRATGDGTTFPDEVARHARGGSRRAVEAEGARHAAAAAAAVVVALEPCRSATSASAQLRTLSNFLRAHEAGIDPDAPGAARVRRARAAVLAVLDGLADALSRHDDDARAPEAIRAAIHHAIEAQTFMPGRHHVGVHLVDAVAARFGEFDDVFLVGLVETDWAERPRRNVFYAASLLRALGWPQEQELMSAQRAAFRDVLTLARRRTRLSAFQLEGDTVVALSTMVEATRGLPTDVEPVVTRRAVFADELLTRAVPPELTEPGLAAWLWMRHARPALDSRAYSGQVAPRAPEHYRVSRVDRYVTCPFKYFSENVLRLPEERDEPAGLTPLERGTLMHGVFENFFRAWQASGRGDRVFELEVASGAGVAERLLESELNGTFTFPIRAGFDSRSIAIRGKTDRIDVLDDGSLRVVDYKLGRMPDLATSVQIGVYAHCAQQWIESRDGRTHPVSAASYLAFGDEQHFEGRLAKSPGEVQAAVLARASAFATTVEKIEAGEFPPRPRKVSECQWCGYAGVCRKEYQVEEDDESTAESV